MDILDGAGETLVLLGVVVLEADLKVDALEELPGLLLGALPDGLHALPEDLCWYLTEIERVCKVCL